MLPCSNDAGLRYADDRDSARSLSRSHMPIRTRSPSPTVAATFLLLALSACAVAAAPVPTPAGPVARPTLTPQARGEAIRDFVLKWAPHVRATYGVDLHAWAMRLVPQFAKSDPANLREALSRTTFEGAMAALDGVGRRLSDDRVSAVLAALPPGPIDARRTAIAKALGDTTRDLVYTPITPCRIVDTRNTPLGAIPANGSRSFVAAGVTDYLQQGGTNGSCGMALEAPTALALNVTVVLPTIAGYTTVFPYGTARPTTASVNYAAGAIVNNAIVAAVPTPVASFDFTVYSYAQAHYVVDLVGYFDTPRSSPVECVDSATNNVVVAAGATASVVATATCPTGYGAASVNCESDGWDMPLVYASGGTCSAKNNGGTTATLKAGWRCCRIPGR